MAPTKRSVACKRCLNQMATWDLRGTAPKCEDDSSASAKCVHCKNLKKECIFVVSTLRARGIELQKAIAKKRAHRMDWALRNCYPKHPVDNELGSDAPDTVRYGSVMNLCRMNGVLLIATTTHLTIGAAPLPRRMLQHSSGGDPVSYKGEIGEFSDTLDLAHFAMFSISRAADYARSRQFAMVHLDYSNRSFQLRLFPDYKATIPNIYIDVHARHQIYDEIAGSRSV
ncbi:hypothetical protein M430DRAFT_16545 [Amorphotheca resinae ATCC 22711]|uniref:Uncharacterized protein n=1 Tax=Amorphotheca resinae ATCC 22711 TaxID=857342 RepID=A0A2T3BC13_AMORE|nr:hypothetical protein M430DRAFT_16545 [Amorphotheca resinae ATCC 22711]PSS25838.1 hypothetical protein M430DRAFT_16545 [Amorphotheca resinae ATCC 22711]